MIIPEYIISQADQWHEQVLEIDGIVDDQQAAELSLSAMARFKRTHLAINDELEHVNTLTRELLDNTAIIYSPDAARDIEELAWYRTDLVRFAVEFGAQPLNHAEAKKWQIEQDFAAIQSAVEKRGDNLSIPDNLLLRTLLRDPGVVLKKADFLARGFKDYGEHAVFTGAIKSLMGKLDKSNSPIKVIPDPDRLRKSRGYGYVLLRSDQLSSE